LGVRYIGDAPLTEDNSLRSVPSLTSNLRVSRKISNHLDLAMDVSNLTNRQNNDISYFYTSRVAGEPLGGVEGVHVHPSEPRTVRVSARMRF
jgi:outer membrane receptor protein involved in Fe transport